MRDERGRKVHEGQVVPGFDFPTDQERAKAIVPAVRALDDPTSRPSMDTAQQRRFALLPNVRRDAAGPHGRVAIAKGIAFVETTVLGATHAAAPLEHHAIEGRGERPFVVQIGGAQDHTDRYAATVGQDVPLRALLRAVGWVRSRKVPPFGAFTITESSALQCH